MYKLKRNWKGIYE